MSEHRSVASRLYAGLGRVTWGYAKKKWNERRENRSKQK